MQAAIEEQKREEQAVEALEVAKNNADADVTCKDNVVVLDACEDGCAGAASGASDATEPEARKTVEVVEPLTAAAASEDVKTEAPLVI